MAMRIGIVAACLLMCGTALAQDETTAGKSDLDAPAGGGETPFGLLAPGPLEDLGALAPVVLDSETGEPLVDAEVELLGTGRQASMTDEQGNARFEDCDFAHATLRVRKEGYIETLVHHPPREKADAPRVVIEMSNLAREQAAFPEIHGEPLDRTKGTLQVRFEPKKNDEIPAAIRVELDAPGATAWVFDAADEVVRGNRLAKDAKERTVVFPNVAAGTYELTADPGSGWTCTSSVGVVRADVLTVVHLSCAKEGSE